MKLIVRAGSVTLTESTTCACEGEVKVIFVARPWWARWGIRVGVLVCVDTPKTRSVVSVTK